MRNAPHKIVFVATLAFSICRLTAAYSPTPAAGQRGQSDEDRAIAALTGLNVPLGRDPSGRVRWIEAGNGELNDAAMVHLAKLTMLDWLEIGGGKLTAAGMTHLKSCAALKRLYIHDVSVSHDALEWLSGLQLEALSLQRTGIEGKVLENLKKTDTLSVLNLSENIITDEDMVQVDRFSSLEVLALQNTKVTGVGLARLKDLKRLNVLNLKNCRIVDADLACFLSMPNLRIVHAAGCDLSDNGVKEIVGKLPLLAIFR